MSQIKPNLHCVDSNIFFSLNREDLIYAARTIDESVAKYIGGLKVRDSDCKVMENIGHICKIPFNEVKYDTPLTKYISIFQERLTKYNDGIPEITSNEMKGFNFGYLIDAFTLEDIFNIEKFLKLKSDLLETDKKMDEFEREHSIVLDRKKTLEKLQKDFEDADKEAPNYLSRLLVMTGSYSGSNKIAGVVNLFNIKAKDNLILPQAKSDLIERLKGFDGPALSLDCITLFKQASSFMYGSVDLVQSYGDILLSNWRERFFKYDP